MSFRHVSSGYDGESTYQFIPCQHYVTVNMWKMDFNFCPYCGAEVGEELDCRASDFPAWAWNHGLRDWDEIPARPKKQYTHWQAEQRCIKPDDYPDDYCDPYDNFKWSQISWTNDKRGMLAELREKLDEGAFIFAHEFRMVLVDQDGVVKQELRKPEWYQKVEK